MARPILVGYDPHTLDRPPVEFGVVLARLTRAPLHVVSVQAGPKPIGIPVEEIPYAVGMGSEDLVRDATPAVEDLAQDLLREGIEFACLNVPGASAAHALQDAAEQQNAALLVLGSTRRGPVGRILPGSTAQRVLDGAPCPTAVVPRHWTQRDLRVIGVGFLDTDEGREALRGACALARRAGATLRVITAVKPRLSWYDETEARTAEQPAKDIVDVEGEHKVAAERSARAAVEHLPADVHVEIDAFIEEPADCLVRLSRDLDLLVVGSRGYGPVRAVLLGGVSRRVITEAHCPVVVLPRSVKHSLHALLQEPPVPAPA